MMCFNIDLSSSFSFVRMFRTVEHYFSESFLVSIFALFVSVESRFFALLVLRSISECTPISVFVSIHSTSSSVRGRASDPCSSFLQLVSLRLDSRLRSLFRSPGTFFTSFCCFFTAATSRCAVCSWTNHSASQDSCRSWFAMLSVASRRHDRLAQTG